MTLGFYDLHEFLAWLTQVGADVVFTSVFLAFCAGAARFGWWCGGEEW